MIGQSPSALIDTSRTATEPAASLSLSRVVATLQVMLATRRAARAAERASAVARSRAQ